jgi:hypothetical protein
MITWGIVSAMAFVWDPIGFYGLRFLLGAAEAAFIPVSSLFRGGTARHIGGDAHIHFLPIRSANL